MQLDFEAIKAYLPQRFPFIMVDKVIELEPGKRAVGIKNISGNDIFFLGHFRYESRISRPRLRMLRSIQPSMDMAIRCGS